MTPVGWASILEANRGAHESEYRRVLAEEGYTGWLHITAVQAIPGGFTWTVTSDLYLDGVVIRRRRLGAYEGYRAPERDMAMAAAAVALEAVNQSQPGECIHAV